MNKEAGSTRERNMFPQGVAVVFGGSGGIGQAICTGLAEEGSDVALSYRNNLEAAKKVVKDVEALSRKSTAVKVELGDQTSVADALNEIKRIHGRIHTVVFSTGADISMTYVSAIDPDEWKRTIDGDLHGFFHVVKAALPILREGGGGSFVAITSAGLDKHPPLDILSVAPKAGIEALMRGIAREEGRYNIRANCVAPGVVDVGLFPRLEKQVGPAFVDAMKKNTALRRFATAEEIANVAVFLASNKAAYVTGQHVAVDGGFSI